MASFTPYGYVPANTTLRGLGLRMPQMTPAQLEQGKREAWLQQTSGAVEPVSYVDIVPNAVKNVTGSDELALVSGFFSPSSFIKRTKGFGGLGIIGKVPSDHLAPALIEPIKGAGKVDAALRAATKVDDFAYRGSHTAPGPDFGAPLYDLTGGGKMYPADVYSPKAAQYYRTGHPVADKEAFAIAQRVKGNPDATVTMYRAVPKDKNITTINQGDWVTLSKNYAKNHGDYVLKGNYKIIEQKVKAKDLWTNADSIHEFGYWPSN